MFGASSELASVMEFGFKLILRCFQSRDAVLLTKAFCVFVRPILEFSSVIWNPLLKRDIVKVESVQRRFTKRLKGFHNLSYTTRLSKLGLYSLHCRHTKAEILSMCYKIIATKLLTIIHALSLLPLLPFHYQVS